MRSLRRLKNPMMEIEKKIEVFNVILFVYRHSNKYTFLFFNQKSTICVQIFNDSQNLTIHIIYRILPRSYSIEKPRYPLLKVVCFI